MPNRLGPDGLGMTCQEHRIRESASVEMEGRVAVDWAGLAKIHSDRLSHRRSDASAVESGYGGSRKSVIPPQPSGWSGFTSMPVPMFVGKTSWDQYRQVFEAIVSSNGWNGGAAARVSS